MSLALVRGAGGFENSGVILNPDYNIVDPLFINGPGAEFRVYNLLGSTYRTYNTLDYTNQGLMEANIGFQFDTRQSGATRWANSFHNDTFGAVNCGTSSNGFILYTSFLGESFTANKCLISATNVVNRGVLSVSPEGFLSISGRNLDLARGRMSIAAYEYSPYTYYAFGQYDGYWGLGTVKYNPTEQFMPFSGYTPAHWVTNRYYTSGQMMLSSGALPFVNVLSNPATSNSVINVAYVQNADPRFTLSAQAIGPDIQVQWEWAKADPLTGTNLMSYLYLWDRMGSISNLSLYTNGYAPASASYRPTLIPTNYSFFTSAFPYSNGIPMIQTTLPTGLFPSTNHTVEFTAYEIQFFPTLSNPHEVANRSYTNMPGRISLSADGPGSVLSLDRARIFGINSLVVKATNHFAGSGGAKIFTPFADFDLGTTNGFLAVSNLIAPTLPRFEGYVDVWSSRFTNVDSANWTNRYHVLFVNSSLTPSVEPRLQNLSLRSTNVVINDVLNILSNLTIRADNLTIASNGPAMSNPTGQLNLLSGQIFWPSSTPYLLNLTNYGSIRSYNMMFFTNQTRPYNAFVNYGMVSNAGSSIAANWFENRGGFYSAAGQLNLYGRDAWLHDGWWYAPGSDINLHGNNVLVTNHVLQTGRALWLTVTNILDDGTLTNAVAAVTNKNVWSVGAGIKLTRKPAHASLLGTTVISTAPADGQSPSVWAGEDRGKDREGFINNAALGVLVLDGAIGSDFLFSGAVPNSALYVDCLILTNSAAVIDPASGDFPAITFGGNIKIYYGQALMNGLSVARRMNGKNGGCLQWVSSQAGFFSGSDVVYPDGTTNRLNTALIEATDVDSDQDGIPNSMDSSPVWLPHQFQFRAGKTNTPAPALALTWRTIGSATNSIFMTTNLTAPTWVRVTNFVSPSVVGPPLPARHVVPLGSGSQYYRLRLDMPQP